MCDGRFICYRPYLARRASAFSRQAAASWGKLVAAALRNRAAMMRRIRASSSPLAAPGRWPLALSWRRPALLRGPAALGAGGGAGRRRPAADPARSRRCSWRSERQSWRPRAGRRWCVVGRGRRPAGRPGSSRRACGPGRQAARSCRSSWGRSARWSPSSLPHLHLGPLAVGLGGEGGVGLEVGQQGAAVAGADVGGLGEAGAGDGLAGREQGYVRLAGALPLARLLPGLLRSSASAVGSAAGVGVR